MSHYSPERKEAVLKKLLPPLNRTVTEVAAQGGVIPPLIMFLKSRTSYAACSSFCMGVILPIAILGLSLL